MENESLPHPPVELLDLATGYQRSKTLFALVEFGLPTLLAGQTLSLDQIARSLGIHQIAADRFLNACVALRLLDRAGTNFSNTVLSETFLVKGKTAYLGDQLRKYDQASYPNWTDLPNKLRNWLPGATDNAPPPPADQGQASMSAQDNLSLLVGHALGQAYDFSIHQKLLDLGGGTGAMSLGICRHELWRNGWLSKPDRRLCGTVVGCSHHEHHYPNNHYRRVTPTLRRRRRLLLPPWAIRTTAQEANYYSKWRRFAFMMASLSSCQ